VKAVKADPMGLLGKSIDNSQVIRDVDPRTSRELFWLILLGAVLVLGGVLYAWPHLQLREAGKEAQELSREKERLLEENRKLRLEKAALENLRRVETIASRDLGLKPPAPEDTIVVEMPRAPVPSARVAAAPATAAPNPRSRN
jgi:cell division protein FtsL